MADNPFDRIIGSYLKTHQGLTERKQAALTEASQRKKQLLDPNYEEFNPDLYNVLDGDTLQHRRTGEIIRIGGEDGYHRDSFESHTRIYDEQPERFERHRRTYAKLYGKDPDDVSKEDLVLVGKVQKARLQNALPQLRGTALNRTPQQDTYGRTVAYFDDMSALEQTSDINTGASYTSPFNYRQRLKDIASGAYGEIQGSTDRNNFTEVPLDFAANVGTGLLKAANSLVHGVVTLLPGQTSKPINDFFVNNQERLDKLQEFLTSDEQTFRQKMDRKEAALGEEIYEIRRKEYERKKVPHPKIRAGYDEFLDRLEYLIENPGQMLDATAESLPYMLGVGAVGRIAVNSAVKQLTGQALKSATKKGLVGEAAQAHAAVRMAQFQTSKGGQALLKKVADRSAVTTVGVTEGFTNASDAYIAVIGMSEAEARQSEKYNALRAAGQTHEEALTTLGEGVFLQTLLTTTAIAAIASKVTGAASFEGNLFRRGVAAEQAVKAARKLKGGKVLRGAQRAALAGGQYARFAGTPGLREAGEEAIQSGGGEFLSQLAQFNQGLTDEVGPGVGRATGEGVAVGFVSGAGAQTTIGGFKKLANAEFRKSGVDRIRRLNEGITPVDRSGTPGGTTEQAQESTQNISPEEAIKTLQELREQYDAEDTAALNEIVQRKKQIDQLAAKAKSDGELSPEDLKFLDEVQTAYVEALDNAAANIQSRDIEEYTPAEKAILQQAMAVDTPAVRELAQDNEQMDRIYSQTRQVYKAMDTQEKRSIQAAGAATDIDSKTSLQVAREKMGDGYAVIGNKRLPGLKAHFNLISEAVAAGDTEAVRRHSEAFLNFVGSQRSKLTRLEKLLEKDNLQDGDKLHEFTYKKNTTEAYYDTLYEEFETMKEVRNRLQAMSRAWNNNEQLNDIPEIPAELDKPKRQYGAAAASTTEAEAASQAPRTTQYGPATGGRTNEEPTEQGPAEDNIDESPSDTGSGTEAASEQETDSESGTEPERIEGTTESAPASSESSESSDTESTTADVSEEVAPVDLETLTVPELKTIARKNKLRGYSKLRKSDLIKLIRKETESNVEPEPTAQESTEESGTTQEPAAETASEPQREPAPEVSEDKPKSTTSAIYTDRDFAAALESIAENSEIALHRPLARRLAEVLQGRKIKIITLNDNEYAAYMRAYAPGLEDTTAAWLGERQEVVMRNKYRNHENMEQAFLHEMTHAAINGWMTRPKSNANQKALHNRALDLRKQILNELTGLANKNPDESRYAEALRRLTENKEEWIAYAWSNPEVQEVLKEIQITETLSAWQGIMRVIKGILGLTGQSGLDHVLAVSDKIFETNKGQRGRSAREGETYTPSPEAIEAARKAQEKADEDVGEQAEAQPERSSETDSEAVAEDIALNDRRWDALRDIKRMQQALANGRVKPDEISFLNSTLEAEYQKRLQNNEPAGALAQLEQWINERLNRNIPRTQISTAELKLPHIIRQAQALRNKGTAEAANKVITAASGFDTEGGFARLQRWLKGTFDTQNIEAYIRRKLAELGLPVSIDDGFRQASKTARSIITAVPNLHRVLENPAARREFYDALELTPPEEKAFETFRQFRDEFAVSLSQAYEHLRDGKIQWKDGNRIEQNPAYLLTDDAELLDPAVVTALAYESMNWLTGDGQRLSNNTEEIIDILGLPENSQLTSDQKRLTTAGTLRRHVVESLGRGAFRHLNIAAQQGPDISPNLDERMEQALGTIAVRALILSERVEPVSFDGAEFAAMKGPELTEHEDYSRPVNFIRIMSDGFEGDLRFYHSTANADLIDDSRPGRTVFTRLFGVSNVVKEPLLTEPTEDNVPKKALRSLMVLSKKLRTAIANQQKHAWTTDATMIDTLRRFENIEDFLIAGHEYVGDLDRIHAVDKDAVLARNRTLETSIENGIKWYEENGTNDFFLTYFVSKTGRTHVGSTFINPQASKIHRFIFRQKGWTKTVPLRGNDKRLLNNFKIAVALGMDFKIDGKGVDKLTQDAVLAKFDEYMDSNEVQEALRILARDGSISLEGEANKPLRDLLSKEGTHTLAALLAWQDYQNARDTGAKEFQTSMPMEVDGVTNGFAAGLLQTPPPNPATIERIKDLSRATGMFYDKDTVRSFAQWLEDPTNQDNYQAAAKLMAEHLKKLVKQSPLIADIVKENLGPNIIELLDSKTGRDFAKNPLMIIAYGAGFASVRRNMVNGLISKLYNNLAGTTSLPADEQMDAVLDILNRAVRVMNAGRLITAARFNNRVEEWQLKKEYTADDIQRMINTKLILDKQTGEPVTNLYGFAQNFEFGQRYDKDKPWKNKKGEWVQYDLRNLIDGLDAAYGGSLERSLKTMLKGIREVRDTYNHAVMLMNAIFKVEFARRLGLIERETGRVVGRKQRAAILTQMHREGLVPSIRTAYSKSLDENLELTAYEYELLKDEAVKIHHPRQSHVRRRHYDSKNKDGTPLPDTGSTTSRLTSRNPSMDVGVAGIVGTVHSLDGTNAADVFGQFGVLNVFDAWVMSIDDMDAVPKTGNRRFAQQHKEYDLGQELLRSVKRMSLLMEPGEGRFTEAQRNEVTQILYDAMDEANQIDRSETSVMPDAPGPLYDYILDTLEGTVPGVTSARNSLMGSLVLSSQFSHDGAAYPIPAEEREVPIEILGDPEDYVRELEAAQKIYTKAYTLASNLDEEGNFTKAVANWLQEEAPRPIEALRVIASTFEAAQLQGAETITQLLAFLAPHLGNVKIIKVGRTKDGGFGEYQNGTITINYKAIKEFNEQSAESVNILDTLLHEIIHAATEQALVTLERDNRDLLERLNERATDAMLELEAKKKRTNQEDRMYYALKSQEDIVIRTSEYMAWTLASVETIDESFGLLFGSTDTFNAALTTLGQTLTLGNTQNPIIRSSQDRVNNKLFENVEEELLESDKLHLNMEAMEELDNAVDPNEAADYKSFVSPVLNGILLPGLAALQDPVFLQVGVETDGTKNIGEVERASDKNILRVQAAGAKLSNNGGMTNQEVFAHELYHAVTGYTIESDTKVRAELRKIYEYARDNLTWEKFMPAEEDIAGDRQAVEKAAKDRYDYIFGEVEFDRDGNPKWDQLQEFAAIGLSNKPLALALSRIDAPSAAEPLWDGNILSFLVNLISRGLELLRSQTLGTRRAQNSADALFKLSQKIVTINQQAQVRKAQKSHNALWRNSFDQKVTDRIIAALDKAQEKLRLSEEEKKQAGKIRDYLRMGTHAALAQRTEDQQKANREFMRHLGVNKSSALSEIISEILPYNKDDRGGADGKVGFLDLLRHSKVTIDIARQRAIEHTRSYLISTFDKKRKHTRAERLAMTNVVLRTDLASLLRHNKDRLTYRDIHQMLQNDALVKAEIRRLENQLATELNRIGASQVLGMYKRQIDSLANYMTRGVMTERNGMKNAHNIVRQYNLYLAADRVPIVELDAQILEPIVDQLATLRALELTPRSDLDKALKVIDHEMNRADDNGFFTTLGMAENYYQSSLKELFDNNPIQMRKGYVYDITDGDINIEVIMDTAAERQRMEDLGMVRIGLVNEDKYDKSAPYPRAMYKGWRGANTWQKAVVSITSEQRQGASLFEVAGYDPQAASFNLGRMLTANHREAQKQFGLGGKPPSEETIAIPVLNEAGTIVDYTYEMSLNARQQHLKNARNNDYFDQVIPRMFGAIPDRVGTRKMNRQTAQLIFDEWEAFKDSPEHNLVNISRHGNRRAKDMFNVVPGEMKRELAQLFRGTQFVDNKGRLIGFPLRDEAVNLVLGFRKLSILDAEIGGKKVIRGQKPTFVAKTAEKIWQEVMQLVRIKLAIINPRVVTGNLSSNYGILLAEGIPVKYIKAKTSEAIRGMRQYQRDIARVDKLQREIGVRQANNQPVGRLIQEREGLKAELRRNPVGRLVQEGLFTSIVEDVTSEEDTYREWILGSALDKLKGPLPHRVVQLAKEAYMVPGSTAFNMAIAATQYGDFIGRYVKFKYDTEVKKVGEHEAINNALASFIYYDMPQNRWLQFMNDNGLIMFSKFFLRIQPVIAKLFQENPVKATGVLAMQQALASPFDENIGTFALFNGIDHRYHPIPLAHVEKLEPTHPSLFQWLWPFGL